MKKISLYFFLLIALFAANSCKKTSIDCFSDPGEISNEVRTIDSAFTCLDLYDNVDADLVASNRNYVEVIAGEKLIDAISTEVINKKLTIRNNSSCNFLRYDDRPTKVIIYYTDLDSITYRSNGNLTALGEITTETFKIDIFEGSGKIHLKLNTLKSFLNFHFGTAELEVEGKSNINYIYQVSYGPINAQLFDTGRTYLETRSANHCRVRASLSLEATINGPGNVYYYGDPVAVALTGSGSGKLIKSE